MLSVQYVCKSIEAENNPVFLETTTPSRNEVHHNFKKFKFGQSVTHVIINQILDPISKN